MKKIFQILLAMTGIIALASCVQQMTDPSDSMDRVRLTFTAQSADSREGTKTLLDADGSRVLWNAQDSISVFRAGIGGKFVSLNKEPAGVAEFTGYLTSVTGSINAGNEDTPFWAVYPFSIANSSDGFSVTFVQPWEQNAMAGSFDPRAFSTVARSFNLNLAFYNVCGGIKFSVQQEGITQVILRGNRGETLAGKITVQMDGDGHPEVIQVEDAVDYVKLSAPAGESFHVGEWYYLVCIPVEFTEGFVLEFKAVGRKGESSHPKAVSVKRSIWGQLEDVDKDVVFVEDGSVDETVPPDDEIWYMTSDSNPIDLNAPTDGNGVRQIADAAVLSNTYENGKGIIKFAGTITSIQAYAFSGSAMNTLSAIYVPNSIQSYGNACFANTNIREFRISDSFHELGQYAFLANSLTRFSGKYASLDGKCIIKDNILYAFACDTPGRYTVPRGVQEIYTGAFDSAKCSEIILPDGLRKIGFDAFMRSSIESITIPDSVESIASNAFELCTRMNRIYGNPEFVTEDNLCFKSYDSITRGYSLNAFFGHDYKNYSIPEGITGIGVMAFYTGGENLWSVSFPVSVTSIGAYAFNGCGNLYSITLADGLQTIGLSAFAGTRVEALTIPATVTWISAQGLACRNLQKVVFQGTTPPAFSGNLFYDEQLNPDLIYVPYAALETYKTAWEDYAPYISAYVVMQDCDLEGTGSDDWPLTDVGDQGGDLEGIGSDDWPVTDVVEQGGGAESVGPDNW